MSVRAVFWYQGEANADETIFWKDQDRATASCEPPPLPPVHTDARLLFAPHDATEILQTSG